MNIFYWSVRTFLKGFFFSLYGHKVIGTEYLPAGPCIIAANHASFYDPPLIAASCPDEIYFLARGSLFDHRLFKTLIEKLNAVPVTGTVQDLASFKIINQLLKEGKKVVIFPEGVRTLDGSLSPIKSGIGMLAMRSQCPIIPTYIYGAFEVWPRIRKFPRLWGKTACVFGPAIHWEEFSSKDKKEAQEEIARQVEQAIKQLKERYNK